MIILQTIIHRPYVFAFLIAFLILGRIHFGWRKTFLWLVIGYVVAWASEVSSIHNGFPYGLYHYIYENMPGELMIMGVPFWDSLSYPFMIFAGYTTAQFLCGNSKSQIPNPSSRTYALTHLRTAFLGAFLTMLLDVIIDPLTVRGDQWFLGNIYYYPNGGQYFGVPITNFLGWFLVPLLTILIFQFINRNDPNIETYKPISLATFLNPLFYLSIALFNIAITVYINEPLIVAIDSFILIPVVGLIMWRIRKLRLDQNDLKF